MREGFLIITSQEERSIYFRILGHFIGTKKGFNQLDIHIFQMDSRNDMKTGPVWASKCTAKMHSFWFVYDAIFSNAKKVRRTFRISQFHMKKKQKSSWLVSYTISWSPILYDRPFLDSGNLPLIMAFTDRYMKFNQAQKASWYSEKFNNSDFIWTTFSSHIAAYIQLLQSKNCIWTPKQDLRHHW